MPPVRVHARRRAEEGEVDGGHSPVAGESHRSRARLKGSRPLARSRQPAARFGLWLSAAVEGYLRVPLAPRLRGCAGKGTQAAKLPSTLHPNAGGLMRWPAPRCHRRARVRARLRAPHAPRPSSHPVPRRRPPAGRVPRCEGRGRLGGRLRRRGACAMAGLVGRLCCAGGEGCEMDMFRSEAMNKVQLIVPAEVRGAPSGAGGRP